MPKEAHLLVRSLQGSLVIMAKGSRDEVRVGYGGEHDQLSPAEFRALIEDFIRKLHAALGSREVCVVARTPATS